MRRHLFDLVSLVVLASVATGVVALVRPGYAAVAVHVYVLVLGGIALAALLARIGDVAPRGRRSPFAAALAPPRPAPAGLPDLERIEREVSLAVASEFDLHRRLLPLLREIATMRLERTGRRLDAETAGRWWPLLQPAPPEPQDRFARGIRPADLHALVDDLEKM